MGGGGVRGGAERDSWLTYGLLPSHRSRGQASVQVVEQCGRFSRMASPGCNLVCWPCGEAVAGGLSLRIQQLDVRCETKTKDNVFVEIVVSVQYLVERESLYDAFYKLTDSRSQVRGRGRAPPRRSGWAQPPSCLRVAGQPPPGAAAPHRTCHAAAAAACYHPR